MNHPYISKPNEITNENYHNSEELKPFISSSVLKQIPISPKWLKYYQEHPEDDRETAEWKLSGACSHAILSSYANTVDLSEFNNKCALFDPPVNETTGNPFGYESAKFIAAFEGFKAINPGKEIYSTKEYDLSLTMVKELRTGNPHLSPLICKFLKIGKAEISCFMKHKPNPVIQADSGLFKWRYDLITNTKIIDWKFVGKGRYGNRAAIKTDDFARMIPDKGYDFSAAFYQYFRWLLTGKWTAFYWVVQEKEPPFDFNIISANNWAFHVEKGEMLGMGPGAVRFIKSLEQYLYCLEKDEWFGASIFTKADHLGQRIAFAKVPGYYKSKEVDYFN